MSGLEYNSFGKGGGLSIIVKGSTSLKTFYITECTFQGNTAEHGGGLFISFLDVTADNTVILNGNRFEKNECPWGETWSALKSSGGGFYFENLAYVPQRNNIITLGNNSFVNNSAYVGGGLSFRSLSYLPGVVSNCDGCSITGTTFTGNEATVGSAIYLHQHKTFQTLAPTHPSAPFSINSCNFQGNHIIAYRPSLSLSAVCTMYSDSHDIVFMGYVEFTNNKASALVMVNANAIFNGTSANFTGNNGTRGAAIALFESSYLLVSQYTRILFYKNTATHQGGAIYTQHTENGISSNCFIKYENDINPDVSGVDFNFTANRVLNGPSNNTIHTTSILPCRIAGSLGGTALCWKGWTYNTLDCSKLGGDLHNYVTTDISPEFTEMASNGMEAFPGWPFQLNWQTRDDLNVSVNDTGLYVITTNNSESSGVSVQDNLSISDTGNITVTLERLGDRPLHVEFDVAMLACPPGFVLDKEYSTCSCPRMEYSGLIQCNNTLKFSVLAANFWIGPIGDENSTYYMALCPVHLCSRKNHSFHILPTSTSALSQQLCADNRQGVLCGECKGGFCLSVNSLTYSCTNLTGEINLASSIAKYISSVYIPYALLLLFLFLFYIELSLGSLSAFVLFAQMVVTSFDLTHHDDKTLKYSHIFPKVYRFLYGAFNLDFLEIYIGKFCFSQHFNILSVLILNYLLFIVPLIGVFAIAAVIKLYKHFSRKKNANTLHDRQNQQGGRYESITKYFRGLSKSLSTNVTQTVATICLLSYSKLSTTSAHILHMKKLIPIDGGEKLKRVYMAGQLSIDNDYLSYKVSAILGEIYLVIFIFLLLDYPLRLLEHVVKRFKPLVYFFPSNMIHTFIHPFQKCYKAQYRFFAGFYFIFRYTVSIVHVATGPSAKKYAVQELACIIMLLFVVICKPYRKSIHNYTDILVFANLAVINALNHYQNDYFFSSTKGHISSFVFGVQFILVVLPALCLAVWAAFKAFNTYTNGTKYFLHKFLSKLLKERGLELEQKLLRTADAMDPGDNDDEATPDEHNASIQAEASVASKRPARRPKPRKAPNSVRDPNRTIQSSGEEGIPVTIVEVPNGGAFGEADMFQTSESEGYYLRNEWNSGRGSYGAIGEGGKATKS